MLENKLGNYFECSPNNVHLFWKGRVGLYSILGALGLKEGEEVIIPAFTCVVVANAIIYHGAKPVYVDINKNNLQFDRKALVQAVNPKTKLIIAQNTFGIPPDYETIEALCKEHDISCIEDCTHGMGTVYKGSKMPPLFIKASFYSFQWNKPLSAGLGGLVICRDSSLGKQIEIFAKQLSRPSFFDSFSLGILLRVRPLMNASVLYPVLLSLFRSLSARGLVLGSSKSSELTGTEMPEGYLKSMSAVQKRWISSSLSLLDETIKKRQINFKRFDSVFASLNLQKLEVDTLGHSALKYPIFVKDKLAFRKIAERKGIKLGDWMNSPIHPVEYDWEKWHYFKGTCKKAELLAAHIFNLQTDLSESEMKRTISFVQENRSLFVSDL